MKTNFKDILAIVMGIIGFILIILLPIFVNFQNLLEIWIIQKIIFFRSIIYYILGLICFGISWLLVK